jgi:hypothetical protein
MDRDAQIRMIFSLQARGAPAAAMREPGQKHEKYRTMRRHWP